MSIISMMMTPSEMAQHLAKQARAKRLELNLSQQTLAKRSGVSYGTLKKFEQTGQISLESLLKLALPLKSLSGFADLFSAKRPEDALTLDDLLKDDKPRQRGRE